MAFITNVREFQALLDACSSTREWEMFFLALKLGYIYSLRIQSFLLASRCWGLFDSRNVCESATEIPY